MFQFPREDFRLHVGWRTIKTAVTAILVAVVYCLLERNPAFACIGVIFGLGTDMPDSIKNGGNRLFGTLIGGLLAIAVFWVYLRFYPQGGHSMLLALLLGAAIVVLILLCQYFLAGRCAARRCGALHRAVQHPGGDLRCLRAQPYLRYGSGRDRGAVGQLFPAAGAGGGLLGKGQGTLPPA